MSVIDKLASAPVITLAAGIAASLATATGITSTLGLSPFFSDSYTAAFFFALAVYWTSLSIKATKTPAKVGFSANPINDKGLWRTATRVTPHATVALLFLLMSARIAIPALQQLSAERWRFCGTLVTTCGASYCLTFSDSRSRPVVAECLRAADSSGYIDYRPKNSTTYRPEVMKLQCPGASSIELKIPDKFFGNSCQSLLEIR